MKIALKATKIIAVLLAIIVSAYTFCCYTNNSFISKWRTIYIETALSTMTHQWLATKLLPPSVVREVELSNIKFNQENLQNNSSENSGITVQFEVVNSNGVEIDPETKARVEFIQKYPEIDISTMPKDIEYLNLAMTDIGELGIKTVAGDSVYAIDTINEILIISVIDNQYNGKLAIVKNTSNVYLEPCRYSHVGDRVTQIMEDNDGVLAINASGFADPNWHGAGNIPVGLVKSHGVEIQGRLTTTSWQLCGIDFNNNLQVGAKVNADELRDAVEFRPVVIVDGKLAVRDSAGWGLQPRTVVGQNDRKEMMFLTIDGRRVGHSIGATMEECGNILLTYGCQQALNMDGGSSTLMAYNDSKITISSSGNENGRHVPNAWVVKGVKLDYTDKTRGVPKSEVEEILEYYTNEEI